MTRKPVPPEGVAARVEHEVVDCAVHHDWTSPRELHPFMSQRTKGMLDASNGAVPPPMSTGFLGPANDHGSGLATFTAVGDAILGGRGVTRAVLVYGKGLNVGAVRDGYFATDIARAANDWTVAEWLNRDSRFAGSIVVASQLPARASDEVKRFAANPQMCQVIMAGNGVGKPFGHPVYHPIYQAATESGKRVAIHAGASGGLNPSTTGGGTINLFIEYDALAVQGLMTHLLSFIAHGVFEKFADLKLILLSGGLTWVPSFAWRADMDFKGVRREVPWVQKLPSEYLRDRVVVGTHPFVGPANHTQMKSLVRMVTSGATVVYSSGFAAWDHDDPTTVAASISNELRSGVMAENANRFYGWTMGAQQRRRVREGESE